MSGFGAALSFLTVLGRATPPVPAALRWFPVVGGLLGVGLGLVWWGASLIFPAAVAAALVLLADLALTGLLHFDGLADSADGLLPHLEPERRLEVMRTPETGAFGVTTVAAVLLARHAGLATAAPQPLLLAALWVASRGFIVLMLRRGRRARATGMGEAFGDGRSPGAAVIAFTTAGVLAAVSAGWIGAVAVAVGLGVAAATIGLAYRRVGGFTGDVLGAAVVLSETAGLMVAAAA